MSVPFDKFLLSRAVTKTLIATTNIDKVSKLLLEVVLALLALKVAS